MKKWIYVVVVVFMIVLYSGDVLAEDDYIHSMGLPSRNEFSWGPMLAIDQAGEETRFGGQLYAGWTRFLKSPLFGVGLRAEGYAEYVEEREFDGGGRLFGLIKPVFLQAGVDYAIEKENAAFILSLAFPLKRGGLFVRGSEFRVDWLPNRNQTFHVGFQLYFGQAYRGKSRPKQSKAELPKTSSRQNQTKTEELSPELLHTLAQIAHAADWMNHYTLPFLDQKQIDGGDNSFLHTVRSLQEHINLSDADYPEGHHFNAEIALYHQMLEEAFGLAVGDRDTGRHIANQVRERIFQDVIVPYNRLLGRRKKHDSLLGYGEQAARQLTSWLDENQQLSETQETTVLTVFAKLLRMLEKNRKRTKSAWGGSEFVWLPLQYGLRPQQYDTREKMNGILEFVAEEPFSDANKIYYVINEQFQPEAARMILQAKDYHVLWIHDYRGSMRPGIRTASPSARPYRSIFKPC